MTFAEIGELTFPQLRAELNLGESEALAKATERRRERRNAALAKVCTAYRMKPRDLAKLAAPDLAVMIRRACDVSAVDVGSLPGQVAEFLEDQG